VGEDDAAVADRRVEALDGVKAAVGERFVNEGPEMFGRLELRTVGWLKHQANTLRYGEVFRPVPAGISRSRYYVATPAFFEPTPRARNSVGRTSASVIGRPNGTIPLRLLRPTPLRPSPHRATLSGNPAASASRVAGITPRSVMSPVTSRAGVTSKA
jgi:hypothetical protein